MNGIEFSVKGVNPKAVMNRMMQLIEKMKEEVASKTKCVEQLESGCTAFTAFADYVNRIERRGERAKHGGSTEIAHHASRRCH